MISSTFQRSPWKICGLFDSGFAGDVDFITSPGLNAPVAVVNDYDPFSDLGMNDHHQGQSLYLGTTGVKVAAATEKQAVSEAGNDSWFDDLDPDLSGDPLGDDSMEAFINLDKFLNGNSFFDEDGNLTVPEGNHRVSQKLDTVAEVAPVINFVNETGGKLAGSLNTGIEGGDQDFLLSPGTSNDMVEKKQRSSRKRPAGSRGGLTTSLYEIPAVSVIPDIIRQRGEEEGSTLTLSDTELDHDYSTKRQRMHEPTGNNNSTPSSTSGTMGAGRSFDAASIIPQTVVILPPASVDDGNCPVQILDESLDKQTIRRIKNNHASKRSREQRKQKFVDMDTEADELVVRNDRLREKIVELEKLAKEMKAVLVAKMAGKAV